MAVRRNRCPCASCISPYTASPYVQCTLMLPLRHRGEAYSFLMPVQDPAPARYESRRRVRTLRGGQGQGAICCHMCDVLCAMHGQVGDGAAAQTRRLLGRRNYDWLVFCNVADVLGQHQLFFAQIVNQRYYFGSRWCKQRRFL